MPETKKTDLGLRELGKRLRKVDETIISLVGARKRLAQLVEKAKRRSGEKIVRLQIEDERVELAATWASQYGVNPNFARLLMYALINESCKVQLMQLQDMPTEKLLRGDQVDESWYLELKENLMELTREVAPRYDDIYANNPLFAVFSYRRFETEVIQKIIGTLPSHDLALDLGCATGVKAFELAGSFKNVRGFDISPHMIEQANSKLQGKSNVSFEVCDIENSLPVADGTVSLAVLNMGTASEFRNLKKTLGEIKRVLRPKGMVFFSFYNAEALLYRFEFLPWSVGLNAEINLISKCLEVHLGGDKTYLVYAEPYTVRQAIDQVEKFFLVNDTFTYPTISSILPNNILDDPNLRKEIEGIDLSLADKDYGSYLIVVGQKY